MAAGSGSDHRGGAVRGVGSRLRYGAAAQRAGRHRLALPGGGLRRGGLGGRHQRPVRQRGAASTGERRAAPADRGAGKAAALRRERRGGEPRPAGAAGSAAAAQRSDLRGGAGHPAGCLQLGQHAGAEPGQPTRCGRGQLCRGQRREPGRCHHGGGAELEPPCHGAGHGIPVRRHGVPHRRDGGGRRRAGADGRGQAAAEISGGQRQPDQGRRGGHVGTGRLLSLRAGDRHGGGGADRRRRAGAVRGAGAGVQRGRDEGAVYHHGF